MAVEVVQHRNTVFQVVNVHTVHHSLVSEVLQQTLNMTDLKEPLGQCGCLLDLAGDELMDSWLLHQTALTRIQLQQSHASLHK